MGCNHSSLVDNDELYSPSADISDDIGDMSQQRLGIDDRPRIVNYYGDSSSSTCSDSSTLSTPCVEEIVDGKSWLDDCSNGVGSMETRRTNLDDLCGGILDGDENQSIDDCSRETVVDWLVTTKSTQYSCSCTFKSNTQPPVIPTMTMAEVPNNDAMLVLPSKIAPHVPSNGGLERSNFDVTQTTKVDRRHVALPMRKPEGLTSGDFLTHRYIVNDYILLQTIGAGGHSIVRLSKHRATNELFAVKIMQKGRQTAQQQQEIAILKKLSHPNIIKLYEAIDDARVDKVYLILEFLQGGDLMSIVERGGPIRDIMKLRDISNQIMCGLSYLHDNNVLQNDLKPSNILVSSYSLAGSFNVKIADFGISTICRIRRGDGAGTPAYMAPEVKDDAVFDGRKADVYSLGATCFFLRSGHPPFIGRNVSELYIKIKTAKLSFPGDIDSDLQDFISRLMEKDPLRRLCLKDALKHHWLCFTNCSCIKNRSAYYRGE
jgi:tRNA A-37 threonylcarbamoyl transferase component Bud32